MRLALVLSACLTAAAFGQAEPPPDYPGTPPVISDPAHPLFGQGEQGRDWFRRVAKLDYTAAPGVTWTMVLNDSVQGDVTVTTPDGRTLTVKSLPVLARQTTYSLGATVLADRIRFTGAAGGSVAGAIPKPGDPYTGGFGMAVPPGSTAVWKTVGPALPCHARGVVYATVAGLPVGSASY